MGTGWIPRGFRWCGPLEIAARLTTKCCQFLPNVRSGISCRVKMLPSLQSAAKCGLDLGKRMCKRGWLQRNAELACDLRQGEDAAHPLASRALLTDEEMLPPCAA